jgi:peptide/nickel transport system ATP-binding protein
MTTSAAPKPVPDPPPPLAVEGITKSFAVRGGFGLGRGRTFVSAVAGCSFALAPGETLGVVGESGCGKSTLARMLVGLVTPDRGQVLLDGAAVAPARGARASIADLRRGVQMVFQDSHASLNPLHTAVQEVAFGIIANGTPRREARRRAEEILRIVGLAPEMFGDRYPHALSGGQRQRVNIARALALSPRVLILDEAVSALDKSVQAQVLNLLVDLKTREHLSYVFISHDLQVVRFISDRVLVMYLGKIVELGPVEQVYHSAAHPYTRALIASQLSMDPSRRLSAAPITGDPPSPTNPPPGCRFSPRCPIAEGVCSIREPALTLLSSNSQHASACHARIAGSGHTHAPVSGVTA